MARIVDEQRQQIQALLRLVDLSGKDVLDIGCADGRLTLLIAEIAASVVGIDVDAEAVEQAKESLRRAGRAAALFVTGDVNSTAQEWAAKFDVVMFSRSL